LRLSCLQENLLRGLSIAGRAVATRTTLPITQNVLITTDQSMLKLSATNLEIAITTWIGAQVEEEGSITIPSRLLTDFVNSLSPERIDIESTSQGLGLELKCGSYEARINGSDADDFPPIPTVDEGIAGKINGQTLKEAITRVAFAAAAEDSRPVLTGIKVEIDGDDFTFAGADGFRLAVYKGKLAEALPENVEFIIPSRSLQEINRLIGSSDDIVEFTITEAKSQALFRLNNVEIVSQLIQGAFPNYSQLVPESYSTRAIIDSSSFLRATRTASIFARDGSGIVRLEMSANGTDTEGSLQISSRAEELGDNQSQIQANVEGDDSKIAFNAKYLAEVLDVLGNGQVVLETTSPSSPGVIKSINNDGYVHVVMPMFVQW